MTVNITLQTALKIDASNLYCKIRLVWLDSSLSVVRSLALQPLIESCSKLSYSLAKHLTLLLLQFGLARICILLVGESKCSPERSNEAVLAYRSYWSGCKIHTVT